MVALSLSVFTARAGDTEWREAVPGYRYQFPRDHFEHEDFRTEWWYYTGNVFDAAGKRYGFELVFFRQGRLLKGPRTAASSSVWDVRDLYLAHAALTDPAGKHFWYEERLNRQGPGIAGASYKDSRVWNGNWSVVWSGETQTVEAVAEHFRFHLRLEPDKPFIIEGENGLSQKAEGRGRASYYVSFPLLKVSGTVNASGVTGRAWMDHEWFTEQLDPAQAGWDWFSVQLDNRTELMLFELRRKDGSIDPWSSGTYIDAEGKSHHLRREDFTLQPLTKWDKYPVEWRIQVPSLHIDLVSKALLPDQELRSPAGGPVYWEGAVDYTGSQTGVGYLEMTGHKGAVRM
jgi:predicted secreted hydrolase